MSPWSKPCSRRYQTASAHRMLILHEAGVFCLLLLCSRLSVLLPSHCVWTESRDRGTHQDLWWADCQNGENWLSVTLRGSTTTAPPAPARQRRLVSPLHPQPRSSSPPLCQPCIIETAYVQMSKVTSSVMQSHNLRPVHACHSSSEDTVLCRSQCFVCSVAHHEATWASWAFRHASGQQQPACDSTQIPSSLTTKYPAAPPTGWHHAGWGCFKVTFKHRVYFNEIWQGLIYDKATIHRMYFSMKHIRTLLWKSKAQGYCLGQNEVRVKSSCTRGKDFGLFEEIPQSSEALVCSGMTLKSQRV